MVQEQQVQLISILSVNTSLHLLISLSNKCSQIRAMISSKVKPKLNDVDASEAVEILSYFLYNLKGSMTSFFVILFNYHTIVDLYFDSGLFNRKPRGGEGRGGMGGDSSRENKTPLTSLTERLRSVWRPEEKKKVRIANIEKM